METGNYICHLCEKEYEPTKRGIQRFCTSKCRKKFSYHKTKVKAELQLNSSKEQLNLAKPYDPNKMTYGGVKEVLAANLLYDGAKYLGKKIFTPPENKNEEKKFGEGYIPKLIKIKNFPTRLDGSVAYFDTQTDQIVYVPDPNYINPAHNII